MARTGISAGAGAVQAIVVLMYDLACIAMYCVFYFAGMYDVNLRRAVQSLPEVASAQATSYKF